MFYLMPSSALDKGLLLAVGMGREQLLVLSRNNPAYFLIFLLLCSDTASKPLKNVLVSLGL